MDRSFLKHAATYGLANVLVQAGGFFLLPIYLRCLTPADYGVLEIAGRLAETAAALLLLGGFRQGAVHVLPAGRRRDRPPPRRGQRLRSSSPPDLAGGAAAAALTPWLSGGDLPPLALHLAVVGILLEPFSLLPLTLIQARVESGTYVVVVVAQFLVRVGLCILLVRGLRWGVPGALAATAITGVVFGLGLSARELARGIAWPSVSHLRAMVAFALPLLPSGACFFVLHNGDRFFLRAYSTSAEIGTYARGYKLAMVVRLFSLVPLYMVWSSRMYAAAEGPDAPSLFGRAFTRILAAYLWAGLGVCLFAPEVIGVLGGAGYAGAAAVVPPIVLACGLQAATTLMDAAFFLRRRTNVKLMVTAAATAVMLVLYAALIPPLGTAGAAVATLGGFAFLAPATYLATQRIFPVRYEWRRLALLCGLTAALGAAGWPLPAWGWAVAAKAALLLAAPVLAWHANLVAADEKGYLNDLRRLALSRLRRRGAEGSVA
ncbi:MAG: oligosaccharide flippase family protein [Gemmataceae bacterium]